jgi:hypothetical protein
MISSIHPNLAMDAGLFVLEILARHRTIGFDIKAATCNLAVFEKLCESKIAMQTVFDNVVIIGGIYFAAEVIQGYIKPEVAFEFTLCNGGRIEYSL